VDYRAVLCRDLDLILFGRVAIPLPGKRRVRGPQFFRRSHFDALQHFLPGVSGGGLTG
jgi:hypothetical protein